MTNKASGIFWLIMFSTSYFSWSQESTKPPKVVHEYYADGTIKSKTKTRIIVPQGGDMGEKVVKTIDYNEEGKKEYLIKERIKMNYMGLKRKVLKEKKYKNK